MKKGDSIKRCLYPGDEWLYFKIYGGIKACDDLVCGKLSGLMKRLVRDGLVRQWFFIRYSDPDFHIRIRLNLAPAMPLGEVVGRVNALLRPMCETRVLHKFVIDTYEREIERYGVGQMLLTEELFCIDSQCVCEVLRKLRNVNPDYRWLAAFVSVDGFLKALGQDLKRRLELVTGMSQSYRAEFGYDEHNGKQLNEIYRSRRKQITQALNSPDVVIAGLMPLFDRRNRAVRHLAAGDADRLNVASLVHMMMNRHFASQNRMNELLLYDFLKRYYTSEIAIGRRGGM